MFCVYAKRYWCVWVVSFFLFLVVLCIVVGSSFVLLVVLSVFGFVDRIVRVLAWSLLFVCDVLLGVPLFVWCFPFWCACCVWLLVVLYAAYFVRLCLCWCLLVVSYVYCFAAQPQNRQTLFTALCNLEIGPPPETRPPAHVALEVGGPASTKISSLKFPQRRERQDLRPFFLMCFFFSYKE